MQIALVFLITLTKTLLTKNKKIAQLAATTGEEEGSEDSSNDKEDSSSLGYEAFQDCLAKAGESPTEQEVQDCIDSSYSGQDNGGQGPNESTDGNDKGDTGVNQELSATDLE